MISLDDYTSYLSDQGKSLGWVRKERADMVMNARFKGDIGYKRVFILDPVEGWKYTDARYSKHAVQSIQKDEVDYYLQFRPKEHYPVGTYVFIPNDTAEDLDINENNPLNGDVSNLWLIVQRNDTKQFVRYLVLPINYQLRWVMGHDDRKEIWKCWCCVRNQNSYTSGIWNDFRVTSLDNLTSAWLPDTYNIFGDKLTEFGLVDTRVLTHQMRMMITHNDLHPNCYMVSKVDDTTPRGIIKLVLKQDDFNATRDSIEFHVCDYYTKSGEISITRPEPTIPIDPENRSLIVNMTINEDGELFWNFDNTPLQLGETYYYYCWFYDDTLKRRWRITLIDEDDEYTEEERFALERLFSIREYSYNTIMITPGKSNKLKGKKFQLLVCDIDGNYEATLDLEVAS